MNYLATNLRFLRNRDHLTLEELPAHIGESRPKWAEYENEKSVPDINTLIDIARYFRISMDQLLIKDLTKDSQEETHESDLWKEIKQLRLELDAHKKDIEHLKKIIAKR